MTEHYNDFSSRISDFISQRSRTKLEAMDKSNAKELSKLEEGSVAWAELKQEQIEKRRQEVENFKPVNWLESASKIAKQISLSSHCPKYIHSDSKSNGALVVLETEDGSEYLVTQAFENLEYDVYGNAAALQVAGLLKLKVERLSLYQVIQDDDYSPFLPFAESEQQAQGWLNGFKLALSPNDIASHALAKQLYFPVEDDYHIISPLFASSLYQQVHESIERALFSDEQKAAREARGKHEFSETMTIGFPDMAVQSFGGTKPQNISQLNTKRYGKVYLLNSAPPEWQTQLKLPTESKNAFWQIYSERAWRKARFLKDYLLKKLKQPSIKAIRDVRGEMVDDLIDLLIATAAEIQNAKNKAGWSKSSQIPEAEKLWLDAYRGHAKDAEEEDKEFKDTREANDWQGEIARSFGEWLNRRLRLGDKLNVGDGEYNEWRRLLEKKLARLKEDLEDF